MNALGFSTTQNRVPTKISGAIENSKTTATVATQARAGASAPATSRKAAIQAIYDSYAEQIYKFIFFKVGNREDAEDITSQVFMKAANSIDVAQAEQSQLAWLYQVARTTITDHWRGYYRGVSTSLDEMEESNAFQVAAEPVFMGTPQEDDLDPAVEKVSGILALLPENYRRVLELRFLQGCSLKETAAAMCITEANTKVIQHRAIQKALKVGAEFI